MTAPAGAARFLPHLLLTAMIAIWGGSYAVVKTALESLPPLAIVALRFWLAWVCLLPFVRPGVLRELRRTAGPGAAAGCALTIGYALQTLGMNETTASMGGFLAGLIVPMVAVGGLLFLHARFGVHATVGLLLGVTGTILLCWPTGDDRGANTTTGIALQIGSSTSYAAHVLLMSHFGRRVAVIPFCLWQLGIVAVVATIATIGRGDWSRVAEVDWSFGLVLDVAYLGVLATALGIGVQSRVQHRIPPAHVALLFALQPVFAAVTGYLAMGDRMGWLQQTGGAVVVAAVVVTSLDRPGVRAAPA